MAKRRPACTGYDETSSRKETEFTACSHCERKGPGAAWHQGQKKHYLTVLSKLCLPKKVDQHQSKPTQTYSHHLQSLCSTSHRHISRNNGSRFGWRTAAIRDGGLRAFNDNYLNFRLRSRWLRWSLTLGRVADL